jgi:hypothetical protein
MNESDLKALVAYIAKALVDNPDDVQVEAFNRRGGLMVELRVAPGDMGRVIGKDGRVANAIRALLRVSGAREGKRITLDIV